MKKSKIILIIGIISLLIVAAGITYAYFSARIIGSESASTVVFEAGSLRIDLSGGNNLVANSILPGSAPWASKTFTVIGNNNSNGYMPYSVNLVVDENTYSLDAISYTLTLVTSETTNNGEPIENRENTPINYTDIIGSGYFTNGKNLKHTYILNLYFLETNTDQSENMMATFRAHIEINGNRASKNKITVNFDADGGELATLSKEVVIGGAYGDLPIPTKEGYEFLGWNGKNLFSGLIKGLYINPNDGNIVFSSKAAISNYICVDYNINDSYFLNGLTGRLYSFIAFYDEEYTFLGRTSATTRDSILLDLEYLMSRNINLSNIKYLRVIQNESPESGTIGDINDIDNLKIQLEIGSEATEYEPYYIDKYTKVVQYENHTLKAIWKEIE